MQTRSQFSALSAHRDDDSTELATLDLDYQRANHELLSEQDRAQEALRAPSNDPRRLAFLEPVAYLGQDLRIGETHLRTTVAALSHSSSNPIERGADVAINFLEQIRFGCLVFNTDLEYHVRQILEHDPEALQGFLLTITEGLKLAMWREARSRSLGRP